jgi:predicted TIM-barrel fold metal-dependent hydrolase
MRTPRLRAPVRIVDSHLHLLPPPLAGRVRALFETYLPDQIVYPIDHEELLARLRSEGVRAGWTLPYAHRAGVARWLNQESVVAHAGHPATAAVLALMQRHPNLHADLTPVVTDAVELPAETLRRFSDRLLFGSDAPNTGLAVPTLTARLRETGLDEPTLSRILGGNADRLIAAVASGRSPGPLSAGG